MTAGSKILLDETNWITPSCGLRHKVEKTWNGSDGKNTLNPWECSIIETHDTVMYRPSFGFLPVAFNAMGEYPFFGNTELNLINESYNLLMQSDFNGDQFIAEGKEAAELVTGRSKDLKRFIKQLYRKQWSRIYSDLSDPLLHRNNGKLNAFLNQLSSMWLENAYGWQPLISDINDAIEVFSLDQPSTEPKVVRPEAYAPKTVAYDDELFQGLIKNTQSVKRAQIINAQPSYSTPDQFGFARFPFDLYRLFSEGRVSQDGLAFLLDQFSSENDLVDQYKNTFFNLLPLSFLFDWLIPVSKFFSAEQALKKADWGAAMDTIKTKRVCTVMTWTGEEGGYIRPQVTTKAITYTRRFPQSLTLSAPKAIPISDAMSFQHTANALALLQGLGDFFRR